MLPVKWFWMFVFLLGTEGRVLRPYKYVKNAPYVTLYENENFRGDTLHLEIGRECANVPEPYSHWASSIESHRRCVDVCSGKNCTGKCARVELNSGTITRLQKVGLNDMVSSVKSCYSY